MANELIMIELPAQMSNWFQPFGRSVFGPLKTYHNEESHQMKFDYTGVVAGKANFTCLFATVWEKDITCDNIISGFRVCGIFPFNSRAIPDKTYILTLCAPHANPTHSTADGQHPTNPSTSQNYECVSDVVLAPELVDIW